MDTGCKKEYCQKKSWCRRSREIASAVDVDGKQLRLQLDKEGQNSFYFSLHIFAIVLMSGKFYKCPVIFEYLQDNCPTDFGLVFWNSATRDFILQVLIIFLRLQNICKLCAIVYACL